MNASHAIAQKKRRAVLLALLLSAAIFLLCFILVLAGAAFLAAAVLCLSILFILAGNFLYDFTLNPRGRFTMSKLFDRGTVKNAENRTAAHQSEASRAWKLWHQNAVAWLESQHQDICITSTDGLRLQGYYFPQEGHLYALLCHGYASKPAHLAGIAKRFYDMGFSVITPFVRGHGPSEAPCYGMGWLDRLDLLLWIDHILKEDPEAEILLYGVSMGGAAVMMAAGEDLPANVKCVIEDCGYSSAWDEFALQMKNLFHLPPIPLLPAADLVCQLRAGYGFREASAVEQLKKASVPMLFIHGEEDAFVPYSMLDVVYQACASAEKVKLSVPGGAHAQSVFADPELYWRFINAFVEKKFHALIPPAPIV